MFMTEQLVVMERDIFMFMIIALAFFIFLSAWLYCDMRRYKRYYEYLNGIYFGEEPEIMKRQSRIKCEREWYGSGGSEGDYIAEEEIRN